MMEALIIFGAVAFYFLMIILRCNWLDRQIDKEIARMERKLRIEESRKSQPIKELERKWNKSKGRHSNQFFTQEWLDLADARAEQLYKKLNWE